MTSPIGLVSSVSTSFSAPYTLARQFASLDRLSNGRAGWNILTSATGEKNYGSAPLPDQETRYAQAAEFIEVAAASPVARRPARFRREIACMTIAGRQSRRMILSETAEPWNVRA